MKKGTIARNLIGSAAVFAAIGLAGCSAETGAPEGAVGATSEALSSVAAKDNAPIAFDAGAICTVRVNSKDLSLLATGIDTSGNIHSNIRLFDRSAAGGSQWINPTLSGSITTARAHAKMIQVPGDVTSCYLLGGLGGTGALGQAAVTATDKALKLSVSFTAPSTYTVTIAAGPTGFTPRGEFQIDKCGADTLLAVGGEDSGTAKNTIQVLQSGGNWTSPAVNSTLSAARTTFAMAQAEEGTSPTHFLVGGGSAAGGDLDSVEALVGTKTTFDCDNITRTSLGHILGSETATYPTATHKRSAPGLFDKAYTAAVGMTPASSTFWATGGKDGTTVYKTTDELVVSWASPPTVTVTAYSNTKDASFAFYGASYVRRSSGDRYFIGGQSAVGTALAKVQSFDTAWNSAALTKRYDAPSVYLPNDNKIEAISGHDPAASPVELVVTEEIAP